MITRKRKDNTLTKQVEASAKRKIEPRKPIDTSVLIPSSSTMLNCACSDNPLGAFVRGSINTVPGASQGGKSILMLTMLAVCCYDERFDDYNFIYDDTEFANHFDIAHLFGQLNSRIKPPAYDKDNKPLFSHTIQDFKAHSQNILNQGKPCIYILDSLDGLSSDQEIEREYKASLHKAKNPEEVAKIKEGYQTEKARGINEAFRILNGLIEDSKSLLFITQQERANLAQGFGQPEFITTGGRAPFFYSIHQVWLKKGKNYTGTGLNQKRKIGHKSYVKVTKNKLLGKERECEFDIYDEIGIDDINSCIDFLKSTGKWEQRGPHLIPHGFLSKEEKIDRITLIHRIEEDPEMYKALQIIVGEAWSEVEQEIRLNRKRRFE